jgi:hypothetical protein
MPASLEEWNTVMKRCFAMLSCKMFRSPLCRFIAPLTLTPRRGSMFSSSGNYIFSIFLKTRRYLIYNHFILIYKYNHIEFWYVDFIESCKVTCHLVHVISAVLGLVLGSFGTVNKQNFGIKTQQVGTTLLERLPCRPLSYIVAVMV